MNDNALAILDALFRYFGPAVGLFVLVMGWLVQQKLKAMEDADKRIESKADSISKSMNDLKEELPQTYVMRSEVDTRFTSLENAVGSMHASLERWMERLEVSLARKADKD